MRDRLIGRAEGQQRSGDLTHGFVNRCQAGLQRVGEQGGLGGGNTERFQSR